MRRVAPLLLWAAFVACEPVESPVEPVLSMPPVPRQAPTATLPPRAGPLAPARVTFTRAPAGFGRVLARDVGDCEACHAEIAAQWRSSGHAAASFDNPIYRVSVEGFRRTAGKAASRMCAGCHDLALLLDGAMDDAVSPDDPRAHAGVSCLSCHGVERATSEGNASFQLRTDEPTMPVAGDEASIRAHRMRMAPPALATTALCGACHRSFLGRETGQDHHFEGIDDIGSWRRSAYAGSRIDRVDEVRQRSCADCHMPSVAAPRGDAAASERGTVRSHRFAGGHSWLAKMQADADQLAEVERMLKGAASIRVAALRGDDGRMALPATAAELRAGEEVTIELVIRNLAVGHRFPGGTLDAVDSWVELEVHDAHGDTIATAGQGWRDGRSDASLHRFAATVVDVDGQPVLGRHIHRFAAKAYDHTVAPRDRQLVRYRLTLPDDVEVLAIEARLMHRSRDPELQRRVCAAQGSLAAHSWAAARRKRARPPLDPCAPQPITIVARDRITIGDGAAQRLDPSLAIDHGAAWTHALVEEIETARASFDLALAALDASETRLRASAYHGLAIVAARQGRIDEMDQWLRAAGDQAPGHPAFAWTRGQALATVWRHDEAARWLRVASAGAAGDERTWVALATAHGSLGQHDRALAAARQALELAPRHPDGLRVQALALRGLGVREPVSEPAFDAFLAHRRRDDAAELRSRCSMEVAGCGRERTPNHVHPTLPSRR
jgi:tetratricopeptide (TPR) repeat protein